MNIATSRVLDVQRHIEQNVQSFLDTHCSDIAYQKTLAVLQRGNWRNRPKSTQVRSVTHYKYVIGGLTAPGNCQLPVTVIRRNHDVAETIRLLLQPHLDFVQRSLLLVFGEVQFGIRIVVVEDVFHPKQFEGQSNEEDIVRWVTTLNDMEAATKVNPPSIEKL